ncbi:MAG: diguanylate cyclase [Candidatus Aminicenantia bacterium]
MLRTVRMLKKRGKGSNGEKRAYFILIHGEPLGQIFEIVKKESIIGRDEKADFYIEDPSISRKHAVVTCKKEEIRIKDLDSTNGTFVNDIRIHETLIQDGDRIGVGRTYLKFSFTDALEEEFYKDFFKLATRDGLTNTINKAYIIELFDRELSRTKRYKTPLSVMMVDIDFFKKVNDAYGHLAGDYLLREIAKIIAGNLRGEDLFGRYGGEEFLIILPDTSIKKAKIVAGKIREKIENKKFCFDNQDIQVTVSIGLGEYSKSLQTPDLLIAAADKNLYIAKSQGRNRVYYDRKFTIDD